MLSKLSYTENRRSSDVLRSVVYARLLAVLRRTRRIAVLGGLRASAAEPKATDSGTWTGALGLFCRLLTNTPVTRVCAVSGLPLRSLPTVGIGMIGREQNPSCAQVNWPRVRVGPVRPEPVFDEGLRDFLPCLFTSPLFRRVSLSFAA
uniref:Uncharacterized protein n=1 Tax=Anopheles atroparvus TaxID=41427 RepID=A0A182JJ34_ANOAO